LLRLSMVAIVPVVEVGLEVPLLGVVFPFERWHDPYLGGPYD
jgi:hypothetical protein